MDFRTKLIIAVGVILTGSALAHDARSDSLYFDQLKGRYTYVNMETEKDKVAKPFPKKVVRITYDGGGNMNQYYRTIAVWAIDGTQVRIAGSCWSACTMYLALPDVCLEETASLHFHAPRRPNGSGGDHFNPRVTNKMFNMYPQKIKNWIQNNGGLGRDWIHFMGPKHILVNAAPICAD
ncbi:hypothetical protein [uncultured Paraglaciecola sp.]|uniref:hypothetical protein n=1 Tax=uncultured Paraglaciecola sp. TaxID=1765024 RepID=UPI002610F6BF|nr:hypothetical protein [uncultured Paraglaciecola sp.]